MLQDAARAWTAERQEYGERYDVDPIDHEAPAAPEPDGCTHEFNAEDPTDDARCVHCGRSRRELDNSEPVDIDVPEPEPEPGACAECGHLHYLGPERGYGPCPVEGCSCTGQAWAEPDDIDVPVPAREDKVPARVCDGCGRTYEPESEGDRGRCCICERDARMEAADGPDWREHIAAERYGRAEPEPTVEVSSGAEPWSELAILGDVDGVRVRLVTGPDGDPRVDLRRFVEGKRYQGPTRKGFAIRASAAGILAELLLEAAAASES
jgi:hypothetical protein